MDPIVRAVRDVNALLSSCDPFDRESVAEYFAKMGEDMGFKPVKNARRGIAKVLCIWKDGKENYLACDVEYGNDKEVLGALSAISAFHPHVGVLITASTFSRGVTDILNTLRVLKPNAHIFVVIDVKNRNALIWRGER